MLLAFAVFVLDTGTTSYFSLLGLFLVHSENQKFFKIPRHIESYGTCIKH